MENHSLLHTVYLKHDNSFKSLTKRALSQIVLKVVYLNNHKGATKKIIQTEIKKLIGVNFKLNDIDDSIRLLENEKKVNKKGSLIYIDEKYLGTITHAIKESEKLQKKVAIKWFKKSETFRSENGYKVIHEWFQRLLIKFFDAYSYEWINELKSNGTIKKKKPKIFKIINSSLEEIDIEDDREWLKKKFLEFLYSDDVIDNELLWLYGTTMFSSTLLSARNYADDFSLDLFKDSKFILDTNIILRLRLEGDKYNYTFDKIEEVFKSINVTPVYLYISRKEYLGVIKAKYEGVVSAFDKYNLTVLEGSSCSFLNTAIQRGCKTIEDINALFDPLNDIPRYFNDDLEVELLDDDQIAEQIFIGQNDKTILKRLNDIHKNRTGNEKRENPKKHDAGLIKVMSFLRLKRKEKCIILTTDGTLKEYANENTIRDEPPIAIGLDSFMQMMALEAGGISSSATDFSNLFSKLISNSLLPEKKTFEVEDLQLILDSKLDIEKLESQKVVEIAKKVNKLRFKNYEDDDIALEIRRDITKDINKIQKEKIEKEVEITRLQNVGTENKETIENLTNQLLEKNIESSIDELNKVVSVNKKKLGMYALISVFILIFIYMIGVNITVPIILMIVLPFLGHYFFKNNKLSVTDDDISKIKKEERKKLSH